MDEAIEFISQSGQIDEIPAENSNFIQIQNLSFKMIMITDNAYLLGRAFGLVRSDNSKIADFVDKGLIRLIDTPIAKKPKKTSEPKSRKKAKREAAEQQSEVLEGLNRLFTESTENVRQTP